MELDGKYAVIVGGASGFGLATLKELAKHGVKADSKFKQRFLHVR